MTSHPAAALVPPFRRRRLAGAVGGRAELLDVAPRAQGLAAPFLGDEGQRAARARADGVAFAVDDDAAPGVGPHPVAAALEAHAPVRLAARARRVAVQQDAALPVEA